MGSVRIELVKVEMSHQVAMQSDKSNLETLLNVSIPDGWPQFPEAFDPAHETSTIWPSYFFLYPPERSLVGNGGFAGTLNEAGEIEIGYEIAPRFQNRGFATAAVKELLNYAFSRNEVRAVVAHTLAEENASNALLKKVGMSFVAEMPNPEVGVVWRWRISRGA
jgi:[ribosomal protein S5]-alanine N-acetyltransferase